MCYFRELLERELKICLSQLETNTDESQELILPDVIQRQFQNSLRSVCFFKEKLRFKSTFIHFYILCIFKKFVKYVISLNLLIFVCLTF